MLEIKEEKTLPAKHPARNHGRGGRQRVLRLGGLAALAAVIPAGWLVLRPHPVTHAAGPELRYTSGGYGGFLPVPFRKPGRPASTPRPNGHVVVPSPEQAAQDAYAAGRYAEVETTAAQVFLQAAQQPTLPHRQEAARAGSLLAYAAARRHDLRLARTRFAAAQKQAAALPGGGKRLARIGENPATLEEDDAFQHAVCTAALGDKSAAEAEYVAFVRRYPDSPLVQASVKRIARLHGGDVPPAAEAVWRAAMQTDQKHQSALQREASLCGPECLAEMLRRRGEPADVHRLAREMQTGERGTALAALAGAARKHGFQPRGLALTQKGLAETLAGQSLPVIALVLPGHYVLVEATEPDKVAVWDPDARGIGRGDRRTVLLAEWQREWHGVTLALAPVSEKTPAVQTARH